MLRVAILVVGATLVLGCAPLPNASPPPDLARGTVLDASPRDYLSAAWLQDDLIAVSSYDLEADRAGIWLLDAAGRDVGPLRVPDRPECGSRVYLGLERIAPGELAYVDRCDPIVGVPTADLVAADPAGHSSGRPGPTAEV